MNMRLLTIFCLLLLLLLPAARNLAAAELDTCNDLYYQSLYDQAIECYRQLGGDRPPASLLYNIGTAHARLGHVGPATLYYLRALYLAPGDTDAAGNLALLRKHHGLFPPDPSVSEQMVALLTVSQWSIVGLAGLLAYLGFAALSLKMQPRRTVEVLMLLLCLLLFIGGLTAAAIRQHYWQQAVVLTDGHLVISPFQGAASIGAIRQGRLVKTHAAHRNFTSVTDETGRTGWLPTDSLESIIPPH
ncbi:MAG: tetratricopeptide repeat protein [Desulfofustis sp.]|nr:tetratricopeptide repeat protein [Desulfofustis sp.]